MNRRLELERLTHALDDALRQLARLADLLAVLGQHANSSPPRRARVTPGPAPRQALAHQLEQLVDGVAKAVVDALGKWSRSSSSRAQPRLLACGQCLLGAVGEQQAVGQAGQRVVVGQVGQFLFRMLDRADVAEHRHVMAELTRHREWRRWSATAGRFRRFCAGSRFHRSTRPFGQRGEDLPGRSRAMAAGLELARALADDLVLLVAGDAHEGPVDVHDQALAVGDQHAFEGAVEHRGGHAQPLTVFAAQARHADEIEQAHPRHEISTALSSTQTTTLICRPTVSARVVSHAVQHQLRQRSQRIESTTYSAAMRKASRTETDMSGGIAHQKMRAL
jgi:hypothetical protein